MCFINRFLTLDDDIIPYLYEAGFGYVGIVISGTKLLPPLINVLLEQWRPETHTFHFPCVEATITLEDVTYYLGLPVDENPITSIAHGNWKNLCEELLGHTPTPDDLDERKIYIKFLDDKFTQLPVDAALKIKLQFARAYILQVTGGILMPDKSRNKVHLMWLYHPLDLRAAKNKSWRSTVLAFLFRELCKDVHLNKQAIGGCLMLLQS
ncbi:serine/threonine-protein phosphatase 7 long form homolog [Hibiscus syriacus]|uniref:serine/threonine-protein phosphatase 7 long form homolog n=1 Tax=Hibiscus syriacus TaxID=106335 RepID=UPI001922A858|nr:serine/threonine-protein phosphatase 7 long form homolog [Hibiscus syriacus]